MTITDHPLAPEIFSAEPINEIGKALMDFQSECPTIDKNTQGYGYRYADLAIIVETIRPFLKKSDLSYSQLPFSTDKSIGVHTILIHGKSGQTLQSKISALVEPNRQKSMTDIQSMGSIITYLRRYALSSMLGIVSDDDTDHAKDPSQNKQTPPSQPAKNQPSDGKPEVTWLTEEQLNKALDSDEKGINAVLKAYNTATKKMKKEYKTKLEAKLKELKK